MNRNEIIGAAIFIPVITLAAVSGARAIGRGIRRVGRWAARQMRAFYGETIRDVMSPELAHLSTKVSSSLDEFAHVNSLEHAKVQGRLQGVEGRLTDVEARLATVEGKLNIRPPDARTRATDKETET